MSPRPHARALVVEPSMAVAGSMRRILESAGLGVRLVQSKDEAEKRCQAQEVDLVFIGWAPTFEGEALCQSLKAQWPHLPVVLFYPPEVDDPSAHAMRAGADAFLVGPIKKATVLSTTHLLLRLTQLIREKTGLVVEQEELSLPEEGDLHDFKRAVVMELRRSQRYGTPVCLLMAAFDASESVLQQHANDSPFWQEAQSAILTSLRDIDAVSRLSDGRFLILLPQTLHDGALAVASRIQGRIGSASPLDGWTVSVGVACCQPTGDKGRVGLTAFIKQAQHALDKARQQGGNRIEALFSGSIRKERISLT